MKHLEIKLRIRELIEQQGGNASAFARYLGIHPNVLATILSNPDKGVTTSLLLRMAIMDISTNWVLTGRGSIKQILLSEDKLKFLYNKIEILESLIKRTFSDFSFPTITIV